MITIPRGLLVQVLSLLGLHKLLSVYDVDGANYECRIKKQLFDSIYFILIESSPFPDEAEYYSLTCQMDTVIAYNKLLNKE